MKDYFGDDEKRSTPSISKYFTMPTGSLICLMNTIYQTERTIEKLFLTETGKQIARAEFLR